ncbi:MAG: glycosyltransferase family 4 protein [Chitinophagaceae bacterium]|nr:glycosyltransferase family 4 protein [Chitinophagaceae bacterium]
MKYPYTGLYFYCLHLAQSLVATNYANRELCFYSRETTKHLFENGCYVEQHSLHKFILPSLKKYNLWHSTYQSSDYFPWQRKIKVVLTIHDLNILYDDSKSAAKKNKFLKDLKARINRADHIVAISEFVLNDIKKHAGIDNTPASVIYNGGTISDLALHSPQYIPTSAFLFTIGTVVSKKNFHVLPPLLANNNLQLIISGLTDSTDYKAKIIDVAKKWRVQNRVIFTGSINENDKQWYLKNCEAFLFPSISEGFGLPVVEAMHFGKPVILSTCTSLPEIGGKDAYYFNDFDPETMQKTLLEALEDYRINKKEDLIKERAAFFNWNNSALQYHQIYDGLTR